MTAGVSQPRPLDLVRTIDGVWCVVDDFSWGWPARVRPKYVPASLLDRAFRGHFWTIEGDRYSRLTTPDDQDLVRAAFPRTCPANGLISSDVIARHVSAVRDRDACLSRRTAVASATALLVRILLDAGVPSDAVGVTGTTLLEAAIDGFSDIDLVIYGSVPIRVAMAALLASSRAPDGPRYRTLAEAIEFHSHYDVISSLTPEQFARHFVRKRAQGLIRGIPFTVFTVPDQPTASVLAAGIAAAGSAPAEQVSFRATIIDDSDANYTACGRYVLRPEDAPAGELADLYCLDRACVDQARTGAAAQVLARRAGTGYLIRPRDGFLLDTDLIGGEPTISDNAAAQVELTGWAQSVPGASGAFGLRTPSGIIRCQSTVPLPYPDETRVLVIGTRDPVSGTVSVQQVHILAQAPQFPLAGQTPTTTTDPAYRHLRVRNPQLAAMFRIRHRLLLATHEFFDDLGFTFVTAPILGGAMTACEDIRLSFRVDQPGEPVFLSQSARVYKEALVYSLGSVYLIQPSFRRDSPSPRHLQEFWHLEAEWLGATHDDLIATEERLLAWLAASVRGQCADDLDVAGAAEIDLDLLRPPFARIDYQDALKRLGLPEGAEITAADELELIRVHGDRPVVLQYFPAAMKGFHAKACSDRPELSQTHDILLPRVGEIAGAGIREEDPGRVERLVRRQEYQQLLRSAGVDPAGHGWYLDLRRYGSAPHGGFGMGIERLLRWITGVPDMTLTIPFPRTEGHYDP